MDMSKDVERRNDYEKILVIISVVLASVSYNYIKE